MNVKMIWLYFCKLFIKIDIIFNSKKILYITECSATTYGQDCANTCSCVAENTADCDNVDGTCTCKPGFDGSDCESGTTYQHYICIS